MYCSLWLIIQILNKKKDVTNIRIKKIKNNYCIRIGPSVDVTSYVRHGWVNFILTTIRVLMSCDYPRLLWCTTPISSSQIHLESSQIGWLIMWTPKFVAKLMLTKKKYDSLLAHLKTCVIHSFRSLSNHCQVKCKSGATIP